MKKTITICLISLVIIACAFWAIKSTKEPIVPAPAPVISSEVVQIPTPAQPTKPVVKATTPEKKVIPKPTTTKPEPTADEMTKELDDLIDAIVSGK